MCECVIPPHILLPPFLPPAGTVLGGGPPQRLPSAAALAQEADLHLRALLDALRQQQLQQQKQQGGGEGAGGGVSGGPLLIVLVKALSVIGVQRPGLLGRALPALMLLAKEVRGGGHC